jgi:hypothetical protein
MNNYWDLYVDYVQNCEKTNFEQGVEPSSSKMEWNHFFPRCIFGEWPVGSYLTIEQHSIASALQSLAFNKSCMCPWHIKYLPFELWELARPIFMKGCKDASIKADEKRKDPAFLENLKFSISQGLLKKFETDAEFKELKKENCKKLQSLATQASKTPESIKKRKDKFKQIRHQQGSLNSQFGTMWVTNGEINKKIDKRDTLPEGFYPGRKLK